jgi:6-phosphogluconolactonase
MDELVNIVVGSYQKKGEKAIQVLRFNLATLEFQLKADSTCIHSPSFVITEGNYLFGVSEEKEGFVVSYYYDKENGRLIEISKQSTCGDSPCYLLYDNKSQTLYATNYMTGSIAVFPVNDKYEIDDCKQLITHRGHSVNYERQEGPHTHSIDALPWANDLKLAQDLGNDSLYLYQSESDGTLKLIRQVQSPLGHGPRHVTFHPNHKLVYVLSELSSTIDIYKFNEESINISLVQSISTLPGDYNGENTAADIHISDSGQFLLASNRGHDSLAIFKILKDGQLSLCNICDAGGNTPRNFAVLPEDIILIANQDSNKINVARLQENGDLSLTNQSYQMDVPVCIKQIK